MGQPEQYRNVKPDYVEKLRSIMNWADVARRFESARGPERTVAAVGQVSQPPIELESENSTSHNYSSHNYSSQNWSYEKYGSEKGGASAVEAPTSSRCHWVRERPRNRRDLRLRGLTVFPN